MIITTATKPCSDTTRPRMPMGASLERGIAYVTPSSRGTGLPTFATKQAPVVGSRAWSPPV